MSAPGMATPAALAGHAVAAQAHPAYLAGSESRRAQNWHKWIKHAAMASVTFCGPLLPIAAGGGSLVLRMRWSCTSGWGWDMGWWRSARYCAAVVIACWR
jgi:hypothetical protein